MASRPSPISPARHRRIRFRTLRAASQQPNPFVSILPGPHPHPVHDLEGVTMIGGTVQMPEERNKIVGCKVALNVAVLRASTGYAEPDPVVYLEGGPGGSAMKMLPALDVFFGPGGRGVTS